MTFAKWLDTLIEEKGIDKFATFAVETERTHHFMSYSTVIEAAKSAPAHEQRGIKNMLVKIDVANGDVRHYLKHLAKGLAERTDRAMYGESA